MILRITWCKRICVRNKQTLLLDWYGVVARRLTVQNKPSHFAEIEWIMQNISFVEIAIIFVEHVEITSMIDKQMNGIQFFVPRKIVRFLEHFTQHKMNSQPFRFSMDQFRMFH